MQEYKKAKQNILNNSEVKKIYNDLETEYKIIGQIINARIKKGISQKQLADKIGTKQSAISRFESGNYNPSLAFLNKISKALDKKLYIKIT